MDSSQNYADLLEPGVRMKKKKKKMERGENSMYDPARGKAAEDSAIKNKAKAMAKKMGVKSY
jgi:hypothetical protein